MASGPLRIWTERVGDPARPAVLMIMGSAAQGVSCPDALVGRLVERGAQVIRFDHRDTGRSDVVDFDAHPYTIGDMARDCLAVLDGYGLGSAHVAGTCRVGGTHCCAPPPSDSVRATRRGIRLKQAPSGGSGVEECWFLRGAGGSALAVRVDKAGAAR